VGFFRREKPLHEKLADEGGLDFQREVREPVLPGPLDHQHPFWTITGIHGIPRVREWDAVASAEAPELPGNRVEFVALADGTIFTDDDLPEGALSPLADALEGPVDPPYHAIAVRQEENVWSVAAMRIDVVEVPEEIAGDKVDLVVNGDERSVLIDDAETKEELPSLEQFAAQQFGSFVLHASRLDDTLWEVAVLPL
jgi:hypothetical protein